MVSLRLFAGYLWSGGISDRRLPHGLEAESGNHAPAPPPASLASGSLTSSEIARGILTQGVVEAGDGRPEAAALALQRTCVRMTVALRDALGDAGCATLLGRALARAAETHPLVKELPRIETDAFHLDGVADQVEAHGIEAVTAALEALFTALIDILARLIGEDMAIRLITQDGARSPAHGDAGKAT